MKRGKWIIVAVVVILIIVSGVLFYNSVFKEEANEDYANFSENLAMPDGITIIDKIDRPLVQGSNLREGEIAIYDKVVVKTIMLEVKKASLVKSSRSERRSISEADRAYSIGAIYKEKAPIGDRLNTIEVLKDGTFITSKNINGKEQYAKGKFGKYTMDFLVGLYTLTK